MNSRTLLPLAVTLAVALAVALAAAFGSPLAHAQAQAAPRPIDGSVRSVNPRAFHPVQQHFFQQRDRFLVARSAKRRRWPCCAKLRSVRTAFTQRRCTSSTLITQSP